jgi:hypothetical protein
MTFLPIRHLRRRTIRTLRRSVARGLPYGSAAWTQRTARRLGLEYTLRPRGWPKKASADEDWLRLVF